MIKKKSITRCMINVGSVLKFKVLALIKPSAKQKFCAS